VKKKKKEKRRKKPFSKLHYEKYYSDSLNKNLQIDTNVEPQLHPPCRGRVCLV